MYALTSPPVTPGATGWVQFVSEDGSRQPFALRFARRGGKPRVVGLVVDNGEEITADYLRSIKLGEAVEFWFDTELDDEDELKALMNDWLESSTDELPALPRRGNAPSDEALRAFVRAYQAAAVRHPRSAMTEVTRRSGPVRMARSTGYRWLRLARERGLYEETEDEA